MTEDARSGRWIEDEYAYRHCSECGYEWDWPEYSEGFCPGCGAKMEGVIDHEDAD